MSQHIVSTNPEVIEKIRTEADYAKQRFDEERGGRNLAAGTLVKIPIALRVSLKDLFEDGA